MATPAVPLRVRRRGFSFTGSCAISQSGTWVAHGLSPTLVESLVEDKPAIAVSSSIAFAWSNTDKDDLLLFVDKTGLSVARADSRFASPEPLVSFASKGDTSATTLLVASGRDVALYANADLQIGVVDDDAKLQLTVIQPRPQALNSICLRRGWLWAATSSSLLLWNIKEITTSPTLAPPSSPRPVTSSTSTPLPAPQRSFSLTAILPNDFQGRDAATITHMTVTPDLRHMLLAINGTRLALLDLDQFLHQRPVLKDTVTISPLSPPPSSSSSSPLMPRTLSSSSASSMQTGSASPVVSTVSASVSTRWFERTVGQVAEENKRAAALAVNGFNKKILSYGVEEAPVLPSLPTHATLATTTLEHPIGSLLASDSCVAVLAPFDVSSSPSSDSTPSPRWTAFSRPALLPLDVPSAARARSLIDNTAADPRWLQLTSGEGTFVLLAGFGQQALLHNLVLFEGQPLAVEVCAMNAWQEKELRLAAVSLGLEYRQASVLQPALDSLSPDQHIPAARRLLDALITAAASALDRGLLQRLFLIATRFLGRVLAERSAQLYASHAGTLRPQPHLLLPVGALSPAQAEARSDVEFLSQALEQLRAEWRKISAPDPRPSRDSLVSSRVRPTTASQPLSFATFPASPSSAVDSAVPSTPEADRPLKERKRNALRPRILFASPPPTPSSRNNSAGELFPASSSGALEAEAAPIAPPTPTLAQLLPRGALERWERLTDGEIVKDGLLRGRLSLALAFLRTRGCSLASVTQTVSRLVQHALGQLQVEQAAEMLQQLGRPVGLHLLSLALHAYRPLLRQQLLSLLKFRNEMPPSLAALLAAAAEVERAYPSASYSLEQSHRSSSSLRQMLPASGRAAEWPTGDVTEAAAEGETAVSVLSRRHGWTAGEGGERGAYAQFSLLLLVHTTLQERQRLLIDASPAQILKGASPTAATIQYLVSHSLLATLLHWLPSLPDADVATAAAALHAMLDSGARLSPAARDIAQDALASRGHFLPGELSSPSALLARAARTWQAFSLLQRHKLDAAAATAYEQHFLQLCLGTDLPHALEAYAELNPQLSVSLAAPGAPAWLPLWAALRGAPSVWAAALASAAFLASRPHAASAPPASPSLEDLVAAAKAAGLLDKPAVAVAAFLHSPAADLVPLVAELRAHNPALLASWLTEFPLLADLLSPPTASPVPVAPLPVRSSRGDASLLPLVESAAGVRLSRAEPQFDDGIPPSAAVQKASQLDLPYFLETAQPLHAFSRTTSDDEAERLARNTSLSRPKDEAVAAACIAFLELRGQFNAAQLLRVDTEATRRVLEWSGAPPAKDVLSLLHDSSPEHLLRFLSMLEEATRASARQDWPLVSRFCTAHALPPSARRFEELAASSDWVLFLQEAETHTFSPSALLPLVARFASPSLREHLRVFLGAWKDVAPERLILSGVQKDSTSPPSLLSILLSTASPEQALGSLLRARSPAAGALPQGADLTAMLLAALLSADVGEAGVAREAAELAEGSQGALMALCDTLLFTAMPARRDLNRAAVSLARYAAAVSAATAPPPAAARVFDVKRIAEGVMMHLLRLPLAPSERRSLAELLAPHADALVPADSTQFSVSRSLLAAMQVEEAAEALASPAPSSPSHRQDAALRAALRTGQSADQVMLASCARVVASAAALRPPLRAPLWRALSSLLAGNAAALSLLLSASPTAPLPQTVKACSPAAAAAWLREYAYAALSSGGATVSLDSTQEACLLLELAQSHAVHSDSTPLLLLLPLAARFLPFPLPAADVASAPALLARLSPVVLAAASAPTAAFEEALAAYVNGDRLAVAEQLLALFRCECLAVRVATLALQLAESAASSAAQDPTYRSLAALLPALLPPGNADTSAALSALRRQSLPTRPFLRRLAYLYDASRALELPFGAVHQRPALELLADLLQAPAAWSGESAETHRMLILAKALADATAVPASALPPLVARVIFSRLERDEGLVASALHLQPFVLFSRNARAVADRLLDLVQGAARGLSASQAADGLIAAYTCYAAASHTAGQERVVAQLRERSAGWLQAGEVKLLVRLLVSVPADLQTVFDALLAHDQFERILQRAAGVKKETEMAETRALLLRYLLRSPHCDEEKLSLFRLAFQMWTDSARAAKSAADRIIQLPKPSTDDLLRALQLYLDASNGFSKDKAVRSSLRCVALAKLVALQLRLPSSRLLGLSTEEARASMCTRASLEEAQTIADAYECNAPPEWTAAVYAQAIRSGNLAFLAEFLHAAPIPTSFIFSELVRRFKGDAQRAAHAQHMRAVLASMESQYLAWELARELGPAFEEALKPSLPASLVAFFRTTR